ncbi:solute carrier family 25 member 48 isoform X5 [Dromaius novaehollandiae]|uniref:solute carrier family 25 member 48 isoform X5 n=1 Tax=Dromaius novaehollandiae TaxID=8790 RepID=UPI000E1F6CCC|nr:solute carrier family 25 member 48 isoform X2 [Dromaius novaehollandiae]
MAEAVDARKPGAHLSALRKTSVSPTPLLRLALGIAWEYQTRLQAGQGYGNTLNCVLTVYRNESVAGFFKGMAFPLASIAVYSSVVFGVFSNTQRLLSQLRYGDAARAPALPDMALASAVAGFVSVGIGTPVDLVKIRLQMQTQPSLQANVRLKPTVPGFPVYRGPIHCFRTVLQKEGIAGIYRGAGAMLLRDVPGYCLYFIPYAFFCGWITPDGCISPNPSSVWLAGGVAGAISWGTATPMDVVKSRLQADGVYVNKYKGILDCILQSYQSEGLKDGLQKEPSQLPARLTNRRSKPLEKSFEAQQKEGEVKSQSW